MKKASTETAEFSSDVESTALRKAIPVAIDIVTPNLAFITTTLARPMKGATLDEWLAKLEADDLSRTYRAIQSGLIEGSATDEIIREVVGSGSLKYKDGVREVTRRGAEMLARTFINHAASMARQAVWEENSDLISSVRWVSTLDGRTSEICRFRDGKLYPVGVGPRPPAHPSCRSTTVAVTKSWRELGFDIDDMPAGTRASMDGQVPSDLTYYQWFKTQSASFQSEVLGVRRYDLWRKGGVTLESFHNDAGRLYTLDQLKAKMPEAYKQAFG
jgi:SPP1 gp7 family putative phage head morphogenesis protein